jgi:hypothetical protein
MTHHVKACSDERCGKSLTTACNIPILVKCQVDFYFDTWAEDVEKIQVSSRNLQRYQSESMIERALFSYSIQALPMVLHGGRFGFVGTWAIKIFLVIIVIEKRKNNVYINSREGGWLPCFRGSGYIPF